MPRGIKLFRILGIQISIDYTWFIVFVLFAWTLSFGYYPHYYPGLGKEAYIIMGSVSTLLLFICILIHELSHSYTANRLGLDIREITLFIFGGVARLTKEPEEASTELKIAVAGPIASGVLAMVFWAASKVISARAFPEVNAVLSYLYLINLLLLAFNMIPGFPLDGGRVLRAIWWARTGDLNAATSAASQVGRAFALFLIIFGFFQIFMGNFIGGLWMLLIGVFLQQAAVSGYQQLLIKRMLGGVKVRDVMTKEVIAIDEETSIAGAVEDYFLIHHFAAFPVTSGGKTTGILTFKQVKSVPREEWADTPVREVMTVLDPGGLLDPREDAVSALTKISNSGTGRLPVAEGGRLVGIVTKGDLLRVLEMKSFLNR